MGAGLKEAFDQGIVKREDVFVVTKLWATYTSRAEVGLEKSLKNLGLEYVDLFLVVCIRSFFFPRDCDGCSMKGECGGVEWGLVRAGEEEEGK